MDKCKTIKLLIDTRVDNLNPDKINEHHEYNISACYIENKSITLYTDEETDTIFNKLSTKSIVRIIDGDRCYRIDYLSNIKKLKTIITFEFELAVHLVLGKSTDSSNMEDVLKHSLSHTQELEDDEDNKESIEFFSGAKTDIIKPPYHLIPPNTLKREAMAWKKGADHYGENNWQKAKGDDKFIKERANHLIEHIFLWLSGDRQEDHLANVRCNAGILMELTDENNI